MLTAVLRSAHRKGIVRLCVTLLGLERAGAGGLPPACVLPLGVGGAAASPGVALPLSFATA